MASVRDWVTVFIVGTKWFNANGIFCTYTDLLNKWFSLRNFFKCFCNWYKKSIILLPVRCLAVIVWFWLWLGNWSFTNETFYSHPSIFGRPLLLLTGCLAEWCRSVWRSHPGHVTSLLQGQAETQTTIFLVVRQPDAHGFGLREEATPPRHRTNADTTRVKTWGPILPLIGEADIIGLLILLADKLIKKKNNNNVGKYYN